MYHIGLLQGHDPGAVPLLKLIETCNVLAMCTNMYALKYV